MVVEGSQRIVKITPDVYAFMLNYCRRGFTDVYADLRFVLSAGTHCPGIIIPLRHSRREQPKFWISFEPSWKILPLPSSLRRVSNRRFSPCARRYTPNFYAPFLSFENYLERRNEMMILFFFELITSQYYYVVIFFCIFIRFDTSDIQLNIR